MRITMSEVNPVGNRTDESARDENIENTKKFSISNGVKMEDIISLAKRRGFIYQGSEIYGGLSGTWDYGPLGLSLKRNIMNLWWDMFVDSREDMYGVDAAILMNQKVWQASGHVDTFTDPLVECRECKARFREDQIDTSKCPNCGKEGTFGEARQFNMMFKTNVGPVQDESSVSYLRPETAQGIFTNYHNVVDSFYPDMPFGLAQIGKAFRNEISPRDFIFRSREFEQMEIEYFVRPDDGARAFDEWLGAMQGWVDLIGLKREHVRVREHEAAELSHYSNRTVDFEYEFPGSMGWKELYGLANRTDFDLRQHMEFSGEDLRYFEQESGERFLPHVVEPTFGVDRTILTVLIDAYDEEQTVDVNGKPDTRVLLRLSPRVAPFKAAILPLMKKPELTSIAWELFNQIQDETAYRVDYDETANIGKRYRRQDEIGTPFCITIDPASIEDQAVTIRDRDTTEQVRIAIGEIVPWLREQVGQAG